MCKLVRNLTIGVLLVAVAAIFGIYYIYAPVTEGTIYLQNAMGESEILRETETSIPHIYASSELMAIYTEGFLHAQERLW